MKFFITPNSQSKHGYDLIVENDDGTTKRIELTRKTGDGYIHLPAEYHEILNRKLVKFTDFEGQEMYEVTKRDVATRSAKKSENSTSIVKPKVTLIERGNILDNPEDKKLWQELCKKIERAELIAAARAEMEKWQREIEKLSEIES
jgi:hypothetical protein